MGSQRPPSRPSQAAQIIVSRIAPLGVDPLPSVEEVQAELERPCVFVYLVELELRWGVSLEATRQLMIDELTCLPESA